MFVWEYDMKRFITSSLKKPDVGSKEAGRNQVSWSWGRLIFGYAVKNRCYMNALSLTPTVLESFNIDLPVIHDVYDAVIEILLWI